MARIILLVGLGGFLGGILRYLMSLTVVKLLPANFPYGTLFVNIVGCFLIGLFFGLSEKHEWMTTEWRIFLTVGFCGGFTTFSSFAYENLSMLNNSNFLGFAIYSICSFALGLLAVWIGLILTKI